MPSRYLRVFSAAGAADGAETSGQFPESGKVGHVVILEIQEREARSGAGPRWPTGPARPKTETDVFGRLVEQFQPTVTAIALRRLGKASQRLELTQEVFLHVLRRIHQFREPKRFAGRLRQVAVRMAINRATRRVPPQTVENSILREPTTRQISPLTS